MAANRTICAVIPGATPALSSAAPISARPSSRRSCATGSAPVASARPTRATPLRSATAVDTTSTRESGSSTQSTGTSWIRSPERSASTRSSVSKNQPVSSHQRQQPAGHVGADRLEAALRVGEARPQRPAQQDVVAARDHLALHAAHHPRRRREPRADREVGVPGDQRGHQREQGVEVGGQVDVHVREHRRVRRRPHRAQRPPATLLVEVDDGDLGELVGQRVGDGERRVGTRVVGDRDPERVGQRVREVPVQAPDARAQVALLVEHGDDDVEDGGPGGLDGLPVSAGGRSGERGRCGHDRSVGRVRGRAVCRTCGGAVRASCTRN